MRTISLESATDVAGFRRHARALIQAQVPPDEVEWLSAEAPRSLWDDVPAESLAPSPAPSQPFTVPASFVDLCNSVLLHREPQRFSMMYRLLWRLRHDAGFWQDRLHPERRRAEQLARDVRREIHKMRAFVRFTPVVTDQGERHVAWFEPEHHVVEANAPFFVRRFTHMRWAILTPERCVEWDGTALHLRPGADRRDAPPPDAGAQLWLTYYEHIFNPARLKVDMMVKEMPRRYWANLPEAVLIEPLVSAANARMQAMVEAAPTPERKVKRMKPVER